ncbi:MAG: carbohydrate-binding protein [Prevotellaceae bacterium]|jgi:hypothetical protein|nr:carbohydrate-binding protein [Prevotellaceae bacterium]
MKKLVYLIQILIAAAMTSGCADQIRKDSIENLIYTDKNALKMVFGAKMQLEASPSTAAFHWTSEDASIVTVSSTGLVEAVGLGETNVIISSGDMRKLVPIEVINRLPSVITRFGNGILLRWNDSPVASFVKTDLKYVSQSGEQKTVSAMPADVETFIADYGGELTGAGVYNLSTGAKTLEPVEYAVNDLSLTMTDKSNNIVEARNFDAGGENAAWSDADTLNRTGNRYRANIGDLNCGVEIGAGGDVQMQAGEWLRYTFWVETETEYVFDIEASVLEPSGADCAISIDGGSATAYHLDAVGSEEYCLWYYASYPRQPKQRFHFQRGRHEMKLSVTAGNVNVNRMSFLPRIEMASLTPVLSYNFTDAGDYAKPSTGSVRLEFSYPDSVRAAPSPPQGAAAVRIVKSNRVKIHNPATNPLYTYTMMWDVRIESANMKYALLQTGIDNTNKNDLMIDNVGSIGMENDGSSGEGGRYDGTAPTVISGKWTRIFLTADLSNVENPVIKVYCDGLFAKRITFNDASLSRMQLGELFWIFTDRDGGYENTIDCAGFSFWNSCLTDEQIAAIGALPQSKSKRIKTVTNFGNGTLVSWDEDGRSELTYTNTDNRRVTVVTYELTTILRDFKTGLSYKSFFNGQTVEQQFPDDQIRDLRYTVKPDETCTVDIRNFDCGGEGVAYHDTNETIFALDNNCGGNCDGDMTKGSDYRNEIGDIGCGVDINVDGYIGVFYAGEWLQYTVSAEQEGDYFFDINLSMYSLLYGEKRFVCGVSCNNGEGGAFSTEITDNGSATAFRWYHKENSIRHPLLHLKRGANVIRITILSGEYSDHRYGNLSIKDFSLRHKDLYLPQGIQTSTLYGNGLRITFADQWLYDYELSYIDQNNRQRSLLVNEAALMITDYKSGLGYITRSGGELIPNPTTVSVTDISATVKKSEPCIIRFIDFDYGGEGISFHDNDATNSGRDTYRADIGDFTSSAVDIDGSSTPPNIGWTNNGEWLRYTVNVEEAGYYAFDLKIATSGSPSYFLEINDERQGNYSLTSWGSWTDYKWHNETYNQSHIYYLARGKNVIKFTTGGSTNLMEMKFVFDHN